MAPRLLILYCLPGTSACALRTGPNYVALFGDLRATGKRLTHAPPTASRIASPNRMTDDPEHRLQGTTDRGAVKMKGSHDVIVTAVYGENLCFLPDSWMRRNTGENSRPAAGRK